MHDRSRNLARRGFLQGAAAVTSALSLLSPSATNAESLATAPVAGATAKEVARGGDTAGLPAAEAGYQSLSPEEAGFVEALVNTMCPADHLTPSGVDCGLAAYIDRQMAGGFGQGEHLYSHGPWSAGKPQHGYQLPLTPEKFFKAGVAVVNDAAKKKYGKGFSDLRPDEANAFLHDLAEGGIQDPSLPLGSWFNELVYPLFIQACFADPIYGGNVGKVFWRMIGYPGLPATHAEDMVQFLGKPYPQAQQPKSIADFS